MSAIARLAIPMPQIAHIDVVRHLVVRVIWSAGIRAKRADVVDLSPMINLLKLYRPLREDPELFKSVHLIEEGRILAWGNDDQIDMAADSVEELAEETMTNDDFREFLKSNNLTHGEAAALLGRSRRQIENYLSGEPIPRVVVLACFGLVARKRSPTPVVTELEKKLMQPQSGLAQDKLETYGIKRVTQSPIQPARFDLASQVAALGDNVRAQALALR